MIPSIDCISVGVDRMQRNFEPMREQVEGWQKKEVTVKVVIYEPFVEGKLEASKDLARNVQSKRQQRPAPERTAEASPRCKNVIA